MYRTDDDRCGNVRWICQCDCGNTTRVPSGHLKSGHTKSCGCLVRDLGAIKNRTHGESKTRLYAVWKSIRQRCNDASCARYADYGGRGIKMCSEWDDYTKFRDWAYQHGYDDKAPYGELTIDRMDANGNYEPNNCRFISLKEQNKNKRDLRHINYNGENHILSEWAELLGVEYATLYNRIFTYGWHVERAFTEPAHKKHRRK